MKAALIVLDGWGLGVGDPDGPSAGGRNAVLAADTPAFDRLKAEGAYGTLRTDGRYVGLPEGQMGNSEVGHLTIGAGRVVKQDSTRISDAIDAGELGDVPAIADTLRHVRETDGRLHLLGLVSDGGVHSLQTHLHALMRLAADVGVDAVTHAFTDGRDTAPKGGREYLADLQGVVDDAGTGAVATVTGRYYAMDRDHNWDRTKRAYDAIVHRDAPHRAPDPVSAVEQSYERGDTDEFVEPTLVAGGSPLLEGDAVLFANFRADRARQLTRMLADIEPEWGADAEATTDPERGFETDPPDVLVTTMTEYDETFDLPVAFPPREPEETLGETVAAAGMTQARLAETEKYAHVTYFLNGGREVAFDGETRRIVDSPDVPTYDRQPEMSAPELTDTALSLIDAEDPDLLVLNYANPDMVGHTGDFDAAVAAIEAVDEQLGRLVPACREADASVLVTADHGNADDMGTANDPHTAHTTNPVPAIALGPDGPPAGPAGTDGRPVDELRDGGLADVAPTLLAFLGLPVPNAMTGRSLLEH